MSQQPIPTEFQQLANRAMGVVQNDNAAKIFKYTYQKRENDDATAKKLPLPYPGLMPPMLVALNTDKFIALFAADNEAAKDVDAKVDHVYDNLAEAYSLFVYEPPAPPVVVKPTRPVDPLLGMPIGKGKRGLLPGDDYAIGEKREKDGDTWIKQADETPWGLAIYWQRQ